MTLSWECLPNKQKACKNMKTFFWIFLLGFKKCSFLTTSESSDCCKKMISLQALTNLSKLSNLTYHSENTNSYISFNYFLIVQYSYWLIYELDTILWVYTTVVLLGWRRLQESLGARRSSIYNISSSSSVIMSNNCRREKVAGEP